MIDLRTAITHLCLFIIAVILLHPVIGWWGILGLWIVLTLNNYEQRIQVEKLIKKNSAPTGLEYLSLLNKAFPKDKSKNSYDSLWDSKDKTSSEEDNSNE